LPFFKRNSEKSKDGKDIGIFEKSISQLSDKDWRIREDGAIALGNLKDLRAVDPLIQALKDKDPAVRECVAEALGKLGDVKAINPLFQVLCDKEDDPQKRAAEALGKIGSPAFEFLLIALNSPENRVREGAVIAIANMDGVKDTRIVNIMIEALREVDCVYVKKALIKMGNAVVAPLITKLKDPDISFRKNAVDILGEIKDPHSVEPLITALDDPDPSVSMGASKALEKMGRFEEAHLRDGPKEWVEAIGRLRSNNFWKERIIITLRANALKSHLGSKIIKILALGMISGNINEGAGHVYAHKEKSKTNLANEGAINIPFLCPVCGLFPGTQEKVASKVVKWVNTIGSLLGGPILGEESTEIQMPFKVCQFCAKARQNLNLPPGIEIVNYFNKDPTWTISLSFINDKFAQEVLNLNKELLIEEATGITENTAQTQEHIVAVGQGCFTLFQNREKKYRYATAPSGIIVITDKNVVLVKERTITSAGGELDVEQLRAILHFPDNLVFPLTEITEAEMKGGRFKGTELYLKYNQSGNKDRIWLSTIGKNNAETLAFIINRSKTSPDDPTKWVP
jgi:hypothetical protein